jgi:hypothetical protein
MRNVGDRVVVYEAKDELASVLRSASAAGVSALRLGWSVSTATSRKTQINFFFAAIDRLCGNDSSSGQTSSPLCCCQLNTLSQWRGLTAS